MLQGEFKLNPQTYTVAVGAGGSGGLGWNSYPQAGASGGPSSVFGQTAIGGGGGGSHGGADTHNLGFSGGSGGGAGSGNG